MAQSRLDAASVDPCFCFRGPHAEVWASGPDTLSPDSYEQYVSNYGFRHFWDSEPEASSTTVLWGLGSCHLHCKSDRESDRCANQHANGDDGLAISTSVK